MTAVDATAVPSSLLYDPALSEDDRRIIAEESGILERLRSFLLSFAPVWKDYQVDEALLELRDSLSEAREDEVAQIVAQMDSLASLSSHKRRSAAPQAPLDLESPYFGHLRVRQDGRVRDILIGGRTLTSGQIPFPIIDWRNAPISRVFYCYQEGDEYEETFGGRPVEGEVLALRKVLILKGRLLRIECPQGTFQFVRDRWTRLRQEKPRLHGGEGAALRPGTMGPPVLGVGVEGQRADRHLPLITGLIDPAQFALITRPESGIVVVDGGAGSGKTTIALHRMAYLAFQNPERFRPAEMLGVVFNKALAAYIGQLLPALGVKGVPIVVLENFFETLRRRHFPDHAVEYNEVSPTAVMRFKQHPAVWEYLQARVRELAEEIRRGIAQALHTPPDAGRALPRPRPGKEPSLHPAPSRAGTRGDGGEDRGHPLLAWDSLAGLPLGLRLQQYDAWVRGRGILPGVGAFGDDWLSRQRLRNYLEETWPQAQSPQHLAWQIWENAFLSLDGLKQACERLAPDVFPPSHLEEVRDWALRFYSEQEEYRTARAALAEAAAPQEHDAPEETPPAPRPPRIDREDDTLLLLLHTAVAGPLRSAKKRPFKVAHLMVDEAQDFSSLELRVLLSLAADPPSVTLSGDTEQRMILHNSFTAWEDVLHQLGLPGTAISPLQVGYRCTAEIMRFSRAVLGALATERPWTPTRSGAPVELLRFTTPGQAVAALGDALRRLMRAEPNANAALIARYAAQADVYYQGLARMELPRLRRVADQDFAFQPGIEVTDISQVKGLEYDYVVLLDVDEATYPDDTASRYLLHIGATRAAHQLWLVACRTPSPLLPEGLPVHLM
jgi:DNA helicase-2/ATP-dependent DNA helicase PcrA